MCSRIILLFVSVLGLQACANIDKAPQTYYYILDAVPIPVQQTHSTSQNTIRQIKILPVIVPDYMNQPNLVIKLNDHQIKITNYHFWAEDLRRSIQRILISELNQRQLDISFTERCIDCAQLVVSISHFYPTESGDVILSGAVEFRAQNAQQIRTEFSFKQSLNEGGFDAAVKEMRALLSQLAQSIEV